MTKHLVALALASLLLVACAGTTPPPTATPSPAAVTPSPQPSQPAGSELDAIIGDWLLEQGTLDGQPIPTVPEAPITLTVNAIRIGGTSACNSYGADWIVSQEGVEIDDIAMTLMLCEGPINDSETAYLEALRRTTHLGMDGNRLVFAGEGAQLRFVRSDG
jgi:heat shock protein HslJ